MKNSIKSFIAIVSLSLLIIPNIISQTVYSQICDSPVNREEIKYTSPNR